MMNKAAVLFVFALVACSAVSGTPSFEEDLGDMEDLGTMGFGHQLVNDHVGNEQAKVSSVYNKLQETMRKELAKVGVVEESAPKMRSVYASDMERSNGSAPQTCVTVVMSGGTCDPFTQLCEIGTYCNSDTITGKCVAPAKSGSSCTMADSAFMCENNNYCKCTSTLRTSCTCTAEAKSGSACTAGYQCQSGGCNLNTASTPHTGVCTDFGTVAVGKPTSSQLFCQAGLLAYAGAGATQMSCVEPSSVTCTISSDCIDYGYVYYSSFFDGIFYPCVSGKCSYTGPTCTSQQTSLLKAYEKLFAPNIIDGSGASYSTLNNPMCSVAKCMYAKNTDGSFNCNSYPAYSSTFSPFDTTWVTTGATCTGTGDRCPLNDYCDAGTSKCTAFPASGAKCAQMYNGGTFSLCGYGLYCNKYYAYSGTNQGSIGTCSKMVGTKGGTCSYSATAGASSTTILSYTACDYTKGLGCDYTTSCDYTAATCELTGKCTTYGSITKSGTAVYSSTYCAFPLIYLPATTSTGIGSCTDLSTRTCTTWTDCTSYYGGDYEGSNDYDNVGGGNSKSGYFGWDYGLYFDSTVCCQSGKCAYNGKSPCTSQYTSALSEYNSNAGACAFDKCMLKGMTASGFVLCTSSGAALAPSAVILLLISAIMLLF